MGIRRLTPRRQKATVSGVQCATPVADPPGVPGWRARQYAKRGLDPHRCACYASVEIDGQPLCDRHAGIRALAILLGEQP